MSQKASEKDPESIQILEAESDPPVEGSSSVISVKTSGGKAILIKREGGQEIEKEEELEKPDLRAFKDRPMEHLQEASQRKFEVVGVEMELGFRGYGPLARKRRRLQSLVPKKGQCTRK